MAIKSGFFASHSDDRQYTAEDFNSLFSGVISDGIFQGYGNEFSLTEYGTYFVIGSGKLFKNHLWLENTDEYIYDISNQSDGSYYIYAVIDESTGNSYFYLSTTEVQADDHYILIGSTTISGGRITSIEYLAVSSNGYSRILGDGNYLPISGGVIDGDLTINEGNTLKINGNLDSTSNAELTGKIIFNGQNINWGYSLPPEASSEDGQIFMLILQ